MSIIKKYLLPQKRRLIFGLSMKAIGTIGELLLPFIMSYIIDNVVPLKDMHGIIFWCVIMILCAFIAWQMNVIANRNASKVARNATENIRHDLFEKTLYLSCEKTDEFTIPSLESRLTTDTYNVHRMIGDIQRMGVRGPIIMLGGLCITMIMEPILSFVFIATIPFIGILMYLRAFKGMPLFKNIQKVNDRMVSIVRENAQGIRVIKALSKTEHERNRYKQINHQLTKTTIHADQTMAVINPGMNLFLNLGLIGVILVGSYRVSLGLSSTGKIIAFMSYFTIMSRSMMAISRIFIVTSQGMASASRINEVLEAESEKDWEKGNFPNGDSKYAIEFKDVTFSYLGVRNNLEHISFQLKKGKSLGIIGATGAGKTTIFSLLMHFYHIQKGAIYVDGEDIRNMEPQTLRKKFGIAMQNDFLFRDTIKENILFDRNISEEMINKAIQTAQAQEFISSIDKQLDYELAGKGNNLSGGQKQRVLLSRSFASNPDFLLLDDSSSALDYQTDAKLRQSIQDNYPDITKIIVAQRISSIMNCDEIIVLEKGRIHAYGTHEQLLHDPLYSSIYESQMGGALFD